MEKDTGLEPEIWAGNGAQGWGHGVDGAGTEIRAENGGTGHRDTGWDRDSG